jgi:hypothetical protein
LRALDEAEIQALAGELLREDGAILVAAARELRRDRSAPLDQALPQALGAAWEAGLRARVEEALKSHLPDDTFRLGR